LIGKFVLTANCGLHIDSFGLWKVAGEALPFSCPKKMHSISVVYAAVLLAAYLAKILMARFD